MNIPPQAAFFYKGKWCPMTDGMVIATAVRMKLERPWHGDGIPSRIAFEAGSIIEKEVGVCFTPLEINQRLAILEARYFTFKQVVATPGTCWVATMQNVVATDEVWYEIIKKHPFAAAYYHRDEPEFSRLCVLFGWDDVKAEDHEETIVISLSNNDASRAPSVPPSLADKSVNDVEEVNSPVTRSSSGARLKLFSEDVESLDRESSNMAYLHYYYAPTSEGRLVRRICNSLPRRPQLANTTPTSSPGASSTASNSPFAPHRKPLP